MKDIETDYIKKLIEIMKKNELTEVILEDSDSSIVIKGNGSSPIVKPKAEALVQKTSVKEKSEEKNLIPIISKMIGVYYSKPSPKENDFVKVGDVIKEGQVVCIIETIKLMNKITSEVSGRVAQICIEDGKPVEYGQVIMYIERN